LERIKLSIWTSVSFWDAHRHRFTGEVGVIKITSFGPKTTIEDPHRPGISHAIQLLGAIAAIANDGCICSLCGIKHQDDKDQSIKRILSESSGQVITPETSQGMKKF